MLIYAHRGASSDFAEGSKAAYQGAIAQGADGFECDVRLTKDQQIICYHDRNTTRLSKIDLEIAKTTYSELKEKVDPYRLDQLLDLAIENKKEFTIKDLNYNRNRYNMVLEPSNFSKVKITNS